MSTRRPCGTLMGAAVVLSTIAPVPTFAEFEKTGWDVQELYKQCTARKGSFDEIFCLEFVSAVARRVFTNGLALKTMSIPSACPKSFVSNEVIVAAFNEWANQHIEKWGVSAQKGVMQAMGDTWPCF